MRDLLLRTGHRLACLLPSYCPFPSHPTYLGVKNSFRGWYVGFVIALDLMPRSATDEACVVHVVSRRARIDPYAHISTWAERDLRRMCKRPRSRPAHVRHVAGGQPDLSMDLLVILKKNVAMLGSSDMSAMLCCFPMVVLVLRPQGGKGREVEGSGRRVCLAPVNRAVKSMKSAWVYDIQQVRLSIKKALRRKKGVGGGGTIWREANQSRT